MAIVICNIFGIQKDTENNNEKFGFDPRVFLLVLLLDLLNP